VVRFPVSVALAGTLVLAHNKRKKGNEMMAKQGDLALLDDPVAQELLHLSIPAGLAYTWKDGTPRLVPIWFHWTGQEVVFYSLLTAPKMKALADRTPVALTIDQPSWPYKVLLIRGQIRVEMVEGMTPEYEALTMDYLGQELGKAWLEQVGGLSAARICVRPQWVSILDFQTRFPSANEAALVGG
jgi:hypothetical protein